MRDGIVVRNNFANKNEPKYGMGTTPSKFVTNYAARVKATEPLSPLESVRQMAKLRQLDLQYSNRDKATKEALYNGEWPNYLYRKLKRADNWNGRTFGNLSLSYTKKTLQGQADDIQKLYEQGHSVNESVISFRIPYLKKMGVIDPRFVRSGRGSLFGHVDQLKLRRAISHGINDMTTTGNYTRPVWIGAIQLDTLHPHCHLVLADDVKLSRSKRLMPRRYQDKSIPNHYEDRGKLNRREKDSLADGINSSLEENLSLHEYQSQPTMERENILSHVDDLVAYQALTNSRLQEVLASLPSDQNKWSMDNKSPEMKHSNRLMNRYLDNMINEYGNQIGYPATVDHLSQYSYLYQRRYHVSDQKRQQIYHQQVTNFRHHLGNIAYLQLGTVVKNRALTDKTGYLQASGESIPELQNDIARSYQGHHVPHVQADLFVYRLNSYPERYRRHIQGMKDYHDALTVYDRQDRKMLTSPNSHKMQRMYRSEFMYNARLTDKYRFMIDRNHDDRKAVRDMGLRRGELEQQKGNLQELVSQPSLDLTIGETKLLKNFRKNPKNKPLMSLKVNQNMNLDQALGEMIDDHSVHMIPIMQKNLVKMCSITPQYQGITNVFQRTNRVHEDNITANATADYAEAYNRYTYRGLLNGTLNHQQYRTPSQVYDQAIQNGNILDPPQAKPRSQHLQPQVFNDVKSDDMADTLYDLSPKVSRNVDPDESQKYQEQTEERYKIADQARTYVKKSGQSNQQLEELLRRIRLQRRIAEEIQKRKKLPIVLRKQYLAAQQHENRLERSIDARHAYHYSQVNVSEWHQQSKIENRNVSHRVAQLSRGKTPVTP